MKVEADCFEDVKRLAIEVEPLIEEKHYVDGSCAVNEGMIDFLNK